MKILVYGAGPLGSLFAARLHEAGHEVTLLARGSRLKDLRDYGIVLEDAKTHKRTVTHVHLVEHLSPLDAYDLVLVIMRKNKALEILPILAANQQTPNVLFLMNNAAGSDALVQSLGKSRVMMGFPYSAGYRDGHVIYHLAGTEDQKITIPIGEPDGQITERIQQIASVLRTMRGYDVEVRTDMDAWLKTHVALLMPSLAAALYAVGTDNVRLANTRDALVLAARAIKEGFQVLHALNIPVVPRKLELYTLLPEPVLVAFLSRLIRRDEMRVALVAHANAAHDEVKYLTDEFIALARQTSVLTPNIDWLYIYFDPNTPRMVEGNAEIPLHWRSIWLSAGIISGVMMAVARLYSKISRPASRRSASTA